MTDEDSDVARPERNWAEHDRQVRENPTLQQARDTGAIHYDYGWDESPCGSWSEAHKQAYREGYEEAEKRGRR